MDYSYGYVPVNVKLNAATNDSVTSSAGTYRLVMQSDGNLVLYALPSHKALWDSKTAGPNVSHAILQSDGNFVVYDKSGKPRFSTNTAPKPDYSAFMIVQDDGNVVMYQYEKISLWATNTAK